METAPCVPICVLLKRRLSKPVFTLSMLAIAAAASSATTTAAVGVQVTALLLGVAGGWAVVVAHNCSSLMWLLA